VENYVRDLSLGLASGGARVTVASSRVDLKGFSTAPNSIGEWNGLRIARVKKYNLPVASIYSFSSNGSKLLKRKKADVIHSHSLPSPGYLGLKLKDGAKAPLVVTLHGGETNILSKRPAFRRINKSILERTDSAVCVSKELVKEARKTFGIKCLCIPNGVDTARFRPLGVERDIDVLFVGMFREEKGLDTLLETLGSFKREPPRTVLVGKGPLRGWLGREIERRKLSKRVTVKGFVSNERLPALLSRSRTFVLPSRTEGLSMALLEAMACGVVPVVTDVGGNADVVGKGRVVPPEDPEGLGNALREMLTLEEKAFEKMSSRSRERVVKRFGLDRSIKAYRNLYEELIR
jgi:glycosyltransferase involved in cell wall biosynthesis